MKIKQIKEYIYNQDLPLDKILLSIRILAKKSKNKDFIAWIDQEIEGYSIDVVDIPKYRILNPIFHIDIANLGGINFTKRVSIQALLPTTDREKQFVESCFNYKLTHSITQISYWANQNNNIRLYPEQAYSYLFQEIIDGGYIQQFYVVVEPSFFKSIENIIRIKLQNFIYELEEQSLNFEEDIDVIESEKISKIYQNNINNNFNIYNNENCTISVDDVKITGIAINEQLLIDKCIDFVKNFDFYGDPKFKEEILKILEESKISNTNEKKEILKKSLSNIKESASFSANLVTSLPLINGLLELLK